MLRAEDVFGEQGGGLLTKSCLTLVTSWTEACLAPLSMGFPRQEIRVGCPFLLQWIFLTQGSNPQSPAGL